MTRPGVAPPTRAGRFTVADPELALTVAAGTTLCLGQLLHDQPDRDDAQATDRVTEDLLRMLGVPGDEAHRICRRPLPDGDPADSGHASGRPRPSTPSSAERRTARPPAAQAEVGAVPTVRPRQAVCPRVPA